MGAWGTDLLENDSASDALGELVAEVAAKAASAGPAFDDAAAARFCAQLAVILYYEPWFFDRDGTGPREALRGVIRENRSVLQKVAPGARPLLDVIAEGRAIGGKPVVDGLLIDRRVRPTLQKLADNLVENIEDDLESQEAGAYLDVLCFVSPHVELPGTTIRHWQRRIRNLVAEADEDEAELFHAYTKALRILVNSLREDEDDEPDDDEEA